MSVSFPWRPLSLPAPVVIETASTCITTTSFQVAVLSGESYRGKLLTLHSHIIRHLRECVSVEWFILTEPEMMGGKWQVPNAEVHLIDKSRIEALAPYTAIVEQLRCAGKVRTCQMRALL